MVTQSHFFRVPFFLGHPVYIGQSANLNRRREQHRTAINKVNPNNSLSLYDQKTAHSFNLDSMEYLFRSSDYFSRRVVEASLISQSFEKNVIHRLGYMQLARFWVKRSLRKSFNGITGLTLYGTSYLPLPACLLLYMSTMACIGFNFWL